MPCVAALFVLFMFVCVFVYDGRCLFVFVFASASNVCINVREPPCSHMFVYVHVRAVAIEAIEATRLPTRNPGTQLC